MRNSQTISGEGPMGGILDRHSKKSG